MGRQADFDVIAELANKVGGLKETIGTTSTDLGDGDPGDAYGELSNAARSGQTMKGFYSSMNSELSAAASLVDAASQMIANAVAAMREDEAQGAHTFGGGNPDRA